ncbi:hypothetical protein BKA62DRAFT_699252 [Auriculariales sp. MPI-PUGE-AT-0066]|nr:hypothetical protein BKA62DRAFT_699252 [Auriculariales sp. MPI-PUGE-AT-0066]
MGETLDFSPLYHDVDQLLQRLWSHGLAQIGSEVRYPDSACSLQDLPNAIFGVFQKALIRAAQKHNDCQPISWLPSEVLGHIFSWISDHRHRASLALVCRQWRTGIMSSPSIWDIVSYKPEAWTTPDALAKLLSLSMESPLHLDIWLGNLHLNNVFDAVLSVLHRCSRLRVSITDDFPRESDEEEKLIHALSGPAPMLRSLRLMDHRGLFNSTFQDSVQLFGGEAPLLREFMAQCELSALASSAPIFSNIRRMLWAPSTIIFQTQDLIKIAELCPQIEELNLDLDDWLSSDECTQRVTLPASLRALFIVVNDSSAPAERLLRTVRHSAIPVVWVKFNQPSVSAFDGHVVTSILELSGGSSVSEVTDADRFIVRSMSFESTTHQDPALNIFMYSEDTELHQLVPGTGPHFGSERIWSERAIIDISKDLELEPTVFAHVVRLYITELAFDMDFVGKPLPSLPMLLHLTIYTLRAVSHRPESDNTSGFITALYPTPMDSHHILQCPSLRTLRIAARVPFVLLDVATRLSADMVVAFIRRYLRYDSKQLQCLHFNGVEIIVVDPLDLQQMFDLAEDVDFSPLVVAWRFKGENLLHWD